MDESINPRPSLRLAEKDVRIDDPVLDVGSLASQLRLGELSGPLRVKGTSVASEVWRRNSYFCFGTIAEGKSRLRYRVPTTSMPRHGEDVVITGTLVLSPLNFELQLHGDIESAWQAKQRLPRSLIPIRSRAPETLAQFLEQHVPNELGFLATDVGWMDVERSAGKAKVAGSIREVANFSDEDDVITAIERLCRNNRIKAVVIARGGGAMLDEICNSDRVAIALINQKLPFYTALGHSNDLMLLDKYADESFGTPSDFGHRLRSTIEHIDATKSVHQKAERLDDENEELKGAISLRERDISSANDRELLLRQQLDKATETIVRRSRVLKWTASGFAALVMVVLVLLGMIFFR
jgi:exodeoxyribonuclease VII large subunit